MKVSGNKYYVYILVCADNSLYTGYTSDLDRRLYEHNHSNRGAKYTRSRRPVNLVYCEEYHSRSEAMRREHEIKKLSHYQKEELIRRDVI